MKIKLLSITNSFRLVHRYSSYLKCLPIYLNVPGSSSVDKEPLTSELRRLLSRLNETSGGFSKIVAVSGSD